MMIQDRNINGIASYIASFGYMAMIMTVLIIVITNMTGLPSIEVLTVSGRIFGLMPGILLCWIGEVIGNIMAFCIIRFFFRNKAHECIEKNKILEKMDSYSNFKEMFIARLIPFSPNVLITTLGALSHLSFRDHTLATIIGKLPSVALEVWLGYGLIQKINGGNAMIYVGIDIAKLNHFASVLSSDGKVLVEPFQFTNDNDGFCMLLSVLNQYDKDNLIVGLESTAHYGNNLVEFLVTRHFPVSVLNPIQTSCMRKNRIRKTKTDKVDTAIIAQTLMTQPFRRFTQYDLDLLHLKNLGRFRRKLMKQRTRNKIMSAANATSNDCVQLQFVVLRIFLTVSK